MFSGKNLVFAGIDGIVAPDKTLVGFDRAFERVVLSAAFVKVLNGKFSQQMFRFLCIIIRLETYVKEF